MKIDWNPSAMLLAKAKRINYLHDQEKLTYIQIMDVVKLSRTYVIKLNQYYRNLLKEKQS